jgi:hypothetical protein
MDSSDEVQVNNTCRGCEIYPIFLFIDWNIGVGKISFMQFFFFFSINLSILTILVEILSSFLTKVFHLD